MPDGLRRMLVRMLDPAGNADGSKVVGIDAGKAAWVDPPSSGGGAVDSVVAGTGITVDDADPANPIVSATGGGGGGGGGTSPSPRATTATNHGTSGGPSITVPSTGISVGDVLLWFVGTDYALSAAPSGWTLLAASNGGWQNGAVMAKSAVSGDMGTTYTATPSGSGSWNSHLSAWSDVGRVLDRGVGRADSPAVSATAGLAAPAVGDVVVMLGSQRVTSGTATLSFSEPTTTTLTVDSNTSGNDYSKVAYKIVSAPGPRAITGSSDSGAGNGFGVALVLLTQG